jgi:hypothetical protein
VSTRARRAALWVADVCGKVPIRSDNNRVATKGNAMKTLMTTLAFSLALLSTSVFAANEAPAMAKSGASAPMSAQQSKMGACNSEAGDKKGDERKAFMKTCLSNKPATQQDKMKSCNKDATGKKGDERKAFMKECLSK